MPAAWRLGQSYRLPYGRLAGPDRDSSQRMSRSRLPQGRAGRGGVRFGVHRSEVPQRHRSGRGAPAREPGHRADRSRRAWRAGGGRGEHGRRIRGLGARQHQHRHQLPAAAHIRVRQRRLLTSTMEGNRDLAVRHRAWWCLGQAGARRVRLDMERGDHDRDGAGVGLGCAAAGMVTAPAARSATVLRDCRPVDRGVAATRYGCDAVPIGTSH